jgi:hypothetical protein
MYIEICLKFSVSYCIFFETALYRGLFIYTIHIGGAVKQVLD